MSDPSYTREILQMSGVAVLTVLVAAIASATAPEHFDTVASPFLEQSFLTQVGSGMLYLGVSSMVIDGVRTLRSPSEIEKVEQEVDF